MSIESRIEGGGARRVSLVMAAVLAVAALGLGFSTAAAAARGALSAGGAASGAAIAAAGDWAAAPGAALIARFGWAAFLLPAWLLAAAIVALLPGFRPLRVYLLGTALVPVLLLAFLARLVSGPAPLMAEIAFLDALGAPALVIVGVLALVLVEALILRLGILLFPPDYYLYDEGPEEGWDRTSGRASGGHDPSRRSAEEAAEGEDGLESELPREDGAPASYGDDEPFRFRVPILPSLPPLKSLGEGRARSEGGEVVEDAGPAAAPAGEEAEEAQVLGGPGAGGSGALAEDSDVAPAEELESAGPPAEAGPEEPIPLYFGPRGAPAPSAPAPTALPAAPPPSPGSLAAAAAAGAAAGAPGGAASPNAPALPPEPAEEEAEDDSLPPRGAVLEIAGAPPIEFTSVPPAPHSPDPAEVEKAAALARLLARRKDIPYVVPTEGILTAYPDGQYWVIDDKTRRSAEILRETLAEFHIEAEVTGIRKGPVITMFEILPAPGVKLSKITNLADNIALRLAASSVRIVAPIPGKHAVGIEVPNERRSIVSLREIVENEAFKTAKMEVPVILGKDIAGEAQYIDLVQTPHLLIAGATGSGKSVSVNTIILSILYRRSPREVKLLLIDPKIVELKLYNDIPHLLTPVITEPKRAFQALQYCICEMERRYSMLDRVGVRDIKSYNRKIKEKGLAQERLPYIVVIVDEFADLMATTGKELESTLARLAAMSRAVGIHLVLATQRPSIDVITGLIKANIPSRIAFMVASKFDSRIIIDMVGAEKLLGKGDMLFASAWDPFPIRMQGAYVSEEEVERAVEHVKTLGEPEYIDEEIFIDDEEDEAEPSLFDDGDGDPLFDQALEIVLQQGKASASYIQRKLKIGYNRAARLVELMEERGIVGPAQGSKPRALARNPEIAGGGRPGSMSHNAGGDSPGHVPPAAARRPLVAEAETLPGEGLAAEGAAASGGGLAEDD